ncbi:MAG: helix-turn-helix transcriptional regulator [Rhodothermales bacterium]|nr:helix-turn-helix transcriptional regulator [Rhodothermales bacterium]MBO6781058.1 helix-turn-helix transcriptional regulator [Rhodothermales bacterium]
MTDKTTYFTSDAELLTLLGKRLRGLRKDQGLTLEEAADRASLNKSTVVGAEKGRNPTLLTLLRLLRVYGRIGAVADFIPEPEVSPLELVGRG